VPSRRKACEKIILLAKAAYLKAQQQPSCCSEWLRHHSPCQDEQKGFADASNKHRCKDYYYDQAHYATNDTKGKQSFPVPWLFHLNKTSSFGAV